MTSAPNMNLTTEWTRWREARERAMREFGVPQATAAKWSKQEALARQRAAETVGYEAAAAAQIMWEDQPDGSTKFLFMIDPTLVPTERHDLANRTFKNGVVMKGFRPC